MIFKLRSLSLALLSASIVLSSASALADTISLSFAKPSQTTAPGATLSFNATVLAGAGNLATVDLNSDFFQLVDANNKPALSLNDDGFNNNFFTVAQNSSTSGLLFTVNVPIGTLAGLYTGIFTIYGTSEADNSAANASANFQITIPGASPVPEPGTWLLLATGLAIGGAAFFFNGKRNLLSIV